MSTSTQSCLRRGVSTNPDARQAARELFEALNQPNIALAMFYCSAQYDLEALEAEMAECFGDVPLIGCTTAGEITPDGYLQGSLTGVSFAGPDFHATTRRLDDLSRFTVSQADEVSVDLMSDLYSMGLEPTRSNTFGYLLIDGLSMREELVASAIHQGLGDLQTFGGSAADGTRFEQTRVYHDGKFHSDAALVALIHTERPFRIFRSDHFTSSEDKMVVTVADPAKRVVTEINGLPACEEYARLVGVEVTDLNPMIFSSHPVLIKAGGQHYVRSIQQVNQDGSLTFFCTIDEGMVLTVAKAQDMLASMQEAFATVEKEIGTPQLVLASDCILRTLEIQREQEIDAFGKALMGVNAVGFSTYGEQFNAIHVNQTFTGVAIA